VKIQDIARLAWSALKDRKLRAALTTLGIIVGPAVIVALNATTAGLSDSITSNLLRIGVDTIYVQRTGDYDLDDKVIQRISGIEGVREVTPFYLIAAGSVKTGGKSIRLDPVETYTVLAIDFRKLPVLFKDIKFLDNEPSAAGRGALVGYRVWNPVDPDNPPITTGALITVVRNELGGGARSRAFEVVGRLDKYGTVLFINPDIEIFIPLEDGALLTGRRSYSGAFVTLQDAEFSNYVVTVIEETFGENVRVLSASAIVDSIRSIFGGINVFLSAAAAMSVVVAFLGIMTTMFTAVNERTREIGLIKALGFKTREVLVSFLMEAILIGVLGGVIGATSGAGLSFLVVELVSRSNLGPRPRPGAGTFSGPPPEPIHIVPTITPEFLLLGVGMAVVVSALAGVIPAYRASRLEPIEALRRE